MMEKSSGVLARALYTNQPEAKNELFFRKGEILTVIETDYDGQLGWWMCALRGKRGICPGNYLELLEDKYSVPSKNKQYQDNSECISQQTDNVLGGTYDSPRSQPSPSLRRLSNRPSAIYVNENLDEGEEAVEHRVRGSAVEKVSPLALYDIPSFELPIYGTFGDSLARKRLQYDRNTLTKKGSSSPSLANFSIRNSTRPSNSTTSNSSSNCDLIKKEQVPSPPRRAPSKITSRSSPVTPPPPPTSSPPSLSPPSPIRNTKVSAGDSEPPAVRLRTNRPRDLKSLRSSAVSESAESGIVMVSSALSTPMQDLYDVPRSHAGAAASNGGLREVVATSSRPQSSISMSSSGMGISIANSESKDSLDMYDVPRSVHSYVSHLETKYEQLSNPLQNIPPHRQTRTSDMDEPLLRSGKSRHDLNSANRQSSISCASSYSGYGYGHNHSRSVHSVGSDWGGMQSSASLESNELYDVPRSQRNLREESGKKFSHVGEESGKKFSHVGEESGKKFSHIGVESGKKFAQSTASIANSEEEEGGATYDVPTAYARRVLSMCESTETLSFPDSLMEEDTNFHLDLGASSSTLVSSASMQNNRTSDRRRWTNTSMDGSVGGGTSDSHVKIFPLGPKAAVSVLERLRQEVIKSIMSILDNVKPKWRSKNNLAEIMPEIRFSVTRLNLAIKDLCDFCSRCLSNAIKLGDAGIQKKLQRLIMPLINASQIIQRDLDELDAYFWSVDRLSVSNAEKSASPPDALDQLVLCARSLKHDVTEIANFLALNSSALFKESDVSPQQSANVIETDLGAEPEDYDYVSLVPVSPEKEMSGDEVDGRKTVMGVTMERREELDWRDELLLEFYSVQIGGTAPLLSQSISTFISAIHQNEPPKVFNGHLKYVILLAYKMLFAGDTVHRNLSHPQLKEQIENKSNELNKSIVELTEASKVATRDFPKIPPMQVIIDRVWETTAAATQLKKVIFNAACALL